MAPKAGGRLFCRYPPHSGTNFHYRINAPQQTYRTVSQKPLAFLAKPRQTIAMKRKTKPKKPESPQIIAEIPETPQISAEIPTDIPTPPQTPTTIHPTQSPDYQPSIIIAANHAPPTRRYNHYLTEGEASIILEQYAEGMSLKKIAQNTALPCYGSILAHIQNNEEFRNQFEAARKVRAIALEEKAIEAAEAASNKDNTPPEALRFNAYKWAASVNDNQRYTQTQKITQEAPPTAYIIVTGVPINQNIEPPKLDKTGKIMLDISTNTKGTENNEQ